MRPRKLGNFNVYRSRICIQVEMLLNLGWTETFFFILQWILFSPFMYAEKDTAQHPGLTWRRCNWIGFCDWIYFFCQPFLSNAVAVASLFFLFSVGCLINAIEVIFLLAWLSRLTKGTLWKRSPALTWSHFMKSVCFWHLGLAVNFGGQLSFF